MSARTVKAKGIGKVAKGLALAAAVRVARVRRHVVFGPRAGLPAVGPRRQGHRPVPVQGPGRDDQFLGHLVRPVPAGNAAARDIYKKYKPMGFTMLGVNVEPDPKAAEAWLGKLASR